MEVLEKTDIMYLKIKTNEDLTFMALDIMHFVEVVTVNEHNISRQKYWTWQFNNLTWQRSPKASRSESQRSHYKYVSLTSLVLLTQSDCWLGEFFRKCEAFETYRLKYCLVLYFVLRGRVYLPWIEVILNVIWRSWESQDFNRCDGFTLFLQYTWTKKYRFIHELQLCLVGIMCYEIYFRYLSVLVF